jgi:hypothetical protein
MKQKPRIDIDCGSPQHASTHAPTGPELVASITAKFEQELSRVYWRDAGDECGHVCVDVYDSSGPMADGAIKTSVHLVARDIAWRNNHEAQAFMRLFSAVLTDDERHVVDMGIYNKTAGLRTLYSSKDGRLKHLARAGFESVSEWTPIASMITYTRECKVLPAINDTSTGAPGGTGLGSDHPLGEALTAGAAEIVAKFADENGLACGRDRRGAKPGQVILERRRSAHCPVCDRPHDSCGGFVTSTWRGIRYYCFRALAEKRSPSFHTVAGAAVVSPEYAHEFFESTPPLQPQSLPSPAPPTPQPRTSPLSAQARLRPSPRPVVSKWLPPRASTGYLLDEFAFG